MKTFVLFLASVVVIPSLSSVLAAECTEEDLISISDVYSQAMTDGTALCPDLTAASDAVDYCSYADCLRYTANMLDDLPDCTSASVNIKEGLQAAIGICEDGAADTSDVFTDISSSSAFATDSSSSSAFATDLSSSSALESDTSSSSAFATDLSSSSGVPTDSASSSSSSLLRTVSPPDSPTSDKITAESASGSSSSSASSTRMAASSATIAMTAFLFAVGL